MPENYTYDIACSGLAASGAVSSAISSITTGVCEAKINSKEWTAAITIAAGGLSGGITAKIAGGDFWEGVCNGLICAGLNHALHDIIGSPDDPPEEATVETSGSDQDVMAGALVIAGALAADDATGLGIVDDFAIPFVLGGAAVYTAIEKMVDERIFLTYTMTNAEGQIYVGRTSGNGKELLVKIMLRRYAGHGVRKSQGYGNMKIDKAAVGKDGYAAIRGREQQLIDAYGGVGSPKVGNTIRGVSKANRNGRYYHDMSNKKFGNIAPYTGY